MYGRLSKTLNTAYSNDLTGMKRTFNHDDDDGDDDDVHQFAACRFPPFSQL